MNSTLASIGLGRRIDSPLLTSAASFQQPSIIIQSRKHSKRRSSSSIVDDTEQNTDSINLTARSRPCSSPVRPNSLVLSSSQKSEQTTDDDNEKYYSAQSSKISTPMVHSIGLRKNSDEKLHLSSIVDLDHEEARNSSMKILANRDRARDDDDLLEKDLL